MKRNQSKHRFKEITKILLKHKIQKGLTPLKLRETIEELGPTYVKLGQIMSTREDLIPKEYCDELSLLKENVSPLSFDIVKEVIQKELNAEINTVFSQINEKPIGSASIGQVHIATLIDGTDVVIKVMRPNILETVTNDFAILKKAVKYLNLFTNLDDVVDLNIIFDETFEAMKLEMNFLNELSNILVFTDKYKDVKYIKLPKVYPNLTTEHILVMEYIDGIRIDDIETLKKNGYNPKEICEKLVENFTTQIIDDGIFHADPHSGNILISDGKIVWLDLGMIGIISKYDQQLYKRAIEAVIKHDVYELKNIILTIGVTKNNCNHALLYQDIESMMAKYLGMDISDMNMGIIIQDVMMIAKKHQISLPKGVTLLGRSLVIIQKTVAILDPNANIMKFLTAHVKENYKLELDVKKKIPDIARKLYVSASKTSMIPSSLYDLLNLTIKGQRHTNIEIVNLKENVNRGNNMVNRLILGIVVSSIILALGIVSAAVILVSNIKWLNIIVSIFIIFGIIFVISLLIFLVFRTLKDRKK
ncbi:MAG: AarF/UbiB family protein [Bacilli bacterium]|nr:AarF/UbiB family protein [Bacilli bacterium]